jgi:hypothetical protein
LLERRMIVNWPAILLDREAREELSSAAAL